MVHVTQGEEYAENDVSPKPKARSRKPEVEDEIEETVDEEEQAPAPSGLSLSPKVIACIVGIVVILVLVIALIVFLAGNKSAVANAEESKAISESMDALPTPAEDVTMAEAVGSTDLPVPMDVDPQNTGNISYNDKTVAALRKWGYTLNEMEIASRDGLSADTLVEAAKEARKQATWETMQSLMDSTSEDYQHLCATTWLGLPPIDVSGFNTETIYLADQYTVNVDFEKIESRGTQLWLKCYLKDGNVVFLQVTPQRYNQLPDSGNIVISYSVIHEGDTYIVTEAREVEVES